MIWLSFYKGLGLLPVFLSMLNNTALSIQPDTACLESSWAHTSAERLVYYLEEIFLSQRLEVFIILMASLNCLLQDVRLWSCVIWGARFCFCASSPLLCAVETWDLANLVDENWCLVGIWICNFHIMNKNEQLLVNFYLHSLPIFLPCYLFLKGLFLQ